jgi:hypothetical protein
VARLRNAGKPSLQAAYADSGCCNGRAGCDCSQMPIALALGLLRVREWLCGIVLMRIPCA